MTYPYSSLRFGLHVPREREDDLGGLGERNLRELLQGSPNVQIPDALVAVLGHEFGLAEVGYTEYTECRYTFSLARWSIDQLNFEPREIQSLDPQNLAAIVCAAIANATQQWNVMVDRLRPKPLLWQYIHGKDSPLSPRVMVLTLSN